MDAFELALEYLRVIIWPAVVLAALLLFRAQLTSLLGRISHAKFPGGELDFEARDVAERTRQAIDQEEEPRARLDEHSLIAERIRQDPGLGLAQLRIEFERRLRYFYDNQVPAAGRRRRVVALPALIRELESLGHIPHNIAAYLYEFIPLANRAIHGETVSIDAAEELGQVGIRLLEDLRRLFTETALKATRSWVISDDARTRLTEARYKVTTVVPLVENPILNERLLTQDGLYDLLEGYEEYAEFIIRVEPIDEAIPEAPEHDENEADNP